MSRLVRVAVVGLALLGGVSCERLMSREQLAKEVLRQDPEFRGVLDRHRALVNRIETYQRELALKRATIEQNITQMRKELAASAANVQTRVAEVRKQMDPERQRLELALSTAAEELRVKRFQRASLGRSIARLRKTPKSAAGAFSDSEQARQQAQLTDMLADAKRLDHEIEALKAHMRLLKVKILLIQF
jgi:hypothetical protein